MEVKMELSEDSIRKAYRDLIKRQGTMVQFRRGGCCYVVLGGNLEELVRKKYPGNHREDTVVIAPVDTDTDEDSFNIVDVKELVEVEWYHS